MLQMQSLVGGYPLLTGGSDGAAGEEVEQRTTAPRPVRMQRIFLAALVVALHLTPVSDWVSGWVGHSFRLEKF